MWLAQAVPWCGSAPTPATLLHRWRLDPVLLILVAAGLLWGVRRARRPGPFVAGVLAATFAVVSPLCPLSVALFAGRAAQHDIITLLAAPLIAWGLGRPVRRPRPLLAASVFALALWAWHAPALYDATFHYDALYWAMHASLGAGALWLWTEVLDRAPEAHIPRMTAVLVSCLQEGVLGALLTLSPRPMFAVHAATTWPFGLSPEQDQALGGALMWIPGALAFLLVALLEFGALLRERSADGAIAA